MSHLAREQWFCIDMICFRISAWLWIGCWVPTCWYSMKKQHSCECIVVFIQQDNKQEIVYCEYWQLFCLFLLHQREQFQTKPQKNRSKCSNNGVVVFDSWISVRWIGWTNDSMIQWNANLFNSWIGVSESFKRMIHSLIWFVPEWIRVYESLEWMIQWVIRREFRSWIKQWLNESDSMTHLLRLVATYWRNDVTCSKSN